MKEELYELPFEIQVAEFILSSDELETLFTEVEKSGKGIASEFGINTTTKILRGKGESKIEFGIDCLLGENR